jgi:hypothetical protein
MVIEKYWQAAQVAGGIAGIDPKILYAQWAHETGSFTSELCTEYNNLAGVTQVEPNDLPQPDGRFYYMKFADLSAWARYFGKFIRLFDGTTEASTIVEYATVLKNEGYYGDDLEVYINGMTDAYNEAFAT